MAKEKSEIITFKVDSALSEALRSLPNRSEFIRTAILNALDSACPVCGGTGVLTPNQRQHWEAFAQDHALKQCKDCEEFYLTCLAGH